jgi:hypothetical protein
MNSRISNSFICAPTEGGNGAPRSGTQNDGGRFFRQSLPATEPPLGLPPPSSGYGGMRRTIGRKRMNPPSKKKAASQNAACERSVNSAKHARPASKVFPRIVASPAPMAASLARGSVQLILSSLTGRDPHGEIPLQEFPSETAIRGFKPLQQLR